MTRPVRISIAILTFVFVSPVYAATCPGQINRLDIDTLGGFSPVSITRITVPGDCGQTPGSVFKTRSQVIGNGLTMARTNGVVGGSLGFEFDYDPGTNNRITSLSLFDVTLNSNIQQWFVAAGSDYDPVSRPADDTIIVIGGDNLCISGSLEDDGICVPESGSGEPWFITHNPSVAAMTAAALVNGRDISFKKGCIILFNVTSGTVEEFCDYAYHVRRAENQF